MLSIIKHHIYKLTSQMLKRYDYKIFSYTQLKSLADFTANLLEVANKSIVNRGIDSIVFSKDRAMQLHAFLMSYKEKVSNRGRMYILYKCTNERHKKSYKQLINSFKDEDFVFIEEIQFRQQFIEILDKSEAGKIIPYVDDMIFTHKIDYLEFEEINTEKYILSLSRGKDMDYSEVLQKSLILPPFTKFSDNLECFNWNYLGKYSDWTYPIGLGGYMFGRFELASMCKAISFKAPNSLESGLQLYLLFFINRFGLCTEFAICVPVHANLVQTEGKNPVLGTFSTDQLLDLWESGKRIELKKFYDKPMKVTQVQKYSFININEN